MLLSWWWWWWWCVVFLYVADEPRQLLLVPQRGDVSTSVSVYLFHTMRKRTEGNICVCGCVCLCLWVNLVMWVGGV